MTRKIKTLRKARFWYCDYCHQIIRKAADGWVEWLGYEFEAHGVWKGKKIQIVHRPELSPHRNGCHYKWPGRPYDTIDFYSSADGHMRLLEMLAEDVIPRDELLEIIKRIHIPNYERARRNFGQALADEVITQDVEYGYWPQSDLREVIREYGI